MRNRNGQGSEPRITARVSDVIDLFLNGRAHSVPEAAALSPITERAIYKAIRKLHVIGEIKRRGRARLSTVALPVAIGVMRDLLKANSEYVKSLETAIEVRAEKPSIKAAQHEPCAPHPTGPDPDTASQWQVVDYLPALAGAGQDYRNKFDTLRDLVRKWLGI